MCRSCANSLSKSLNFCPIRCKLAPGQTASLKQVVLSFGMHPLSDPDVHDVVGAASSSQSLRLVDGVGHEEATGAQTTMRLLEDFASSDPTSILKQENIRSSGNRSLIFSRAARTVSLISERIGLENGAKVVL